MLLYLWVPKIANVDLVTFKPLIQNTDVTVQNTVAGGFGAHGTSIFLYVLTDNNVQLPRE